MCEKGLEWKKVSRVCVCKFAIHYYLLLVLTTLLKSISLVITFLSALLVYLECSIREYSLRVLIYVKRSKPTFTLVHRACQPIANCSRWRSFTTVELNCILLQNLCGNNNHFTGKLSQLPINPQTPRNFSTSNDLQYTIMLFNMLFWYRPYHQWIHYIKITK